MVTDIFEKIVSNSKEINYSGIKNVLILYEERLSYIGDGCMRFDKLRYFRAFLNNAAIDINFSNKDNFEFCEALIKNNPHLDSLSFNSLQQITFDKYDIIFCVARDEKILLEYICDKYSISIADGSFRLAIFSISSLLLVPEESSNYLFAENEEMNKYILVKKPGELYISEEEQNWADCWLIEHGLKKEESLFIFCDSSSAKDKLIKAPVYFDLLNALQVYKNVKFLIFDEKNIGKEEFYGKWLGSKALKNFIFSKGLSLRQNLCLMASGFTKLIFGPCTGLMHCCSSIYNFYVTNGQPVDTVPLMITYTGQYTKENKNANFWWGEAPLINCLLLNEKFGKKEMVLLSSMDDDEKESVEPAPCSEYTKEMILHFIQERLPVNCKKMVDN